MLIVDEKMRARFWSKVAVSPADACWEWLASKGRGENCYGQFMTHHNGKQRLMRANRVAWVLSFGEIPQGLHVLHHCDNRGCVNPSHLFLGTHKDNMNDMDRKGRRVIQVGEDASASRLSERDVLLMRERYRRGASSSDVAKEFGIGRGAAWSVVTGRTWSHVPGAVVGRKWDQSGPRNPCYKHGRYCRGENVGHEG